MSGEAPILVKTWTVGSGRYTVTLSVPRLRRGETLSAAVEWEPQPKELTTEEVREYREKRNLALLELSATLGGTVAVFDVAPSARSGSRACVFAPARVGN